MHVKTDLGDQTPPDPGCGCPERYGNPVAAGGAVGDPVAGGGAAGVVRREFGRIDRDKAAN